MVPVITLNLFQCNINLDGNQEKSLVLPCDAVESIQLQPRAGSESDGTLVPFAQGLFPLYFFL